MSKLKELKKQQRKEAQKKLRTETDKKTSIKHKTPLPKGHITPRKAIVTFKMEDVLVGRSIYNIMEDIDDE